MASRGLLFPPSFRPYVFNTIAAVTLVPIAAGTYGLLNPAAGIKLLYFPAPSSGGGGRGDSHDVRLAHGLFRMYAVRQVTVALCSLAMWATGSWRALGWSSLAGILMAATDGVIAKQVTGLHVAGHWVGVGLGLVFSGTLLGLL